MGSIAIQLVKLAGLRVMFSRPMLGYEQQKQGDMLATIAKLIDDNKLQTITGTVLQGLKSLDEAEKLQTSGKAIGKIVVQVI